MVIDNTQFLSKIDYGAISSYNTCDRDIKLLCLEAEKHGITTVVVQPAHLSYALKAAKGTELKIASLCSYPFGAYPPEVKEKEIEELIGLGADEVYMLACIGSVLEGNWGQINKEMEALIRASEGRTTKLIIEMSSLDDYQLERIVFLALEKGVDYLVTGTAFKPNNMGTPSLSRLKSLKRIGQGGIGIVVNGDSYRPEDLLTLTESGIDRILLENLNNIAIEV